MDEDTDTDQGSDDSGDAGYAGDDTITDPSADSSDDATDDGGDAYGDGDADGSWDAGAAAGGDGSEDGAGISADGGDDGTGADDGQGADADGYIGVADYATDSLASGAGEFVHGLGEMASGAGHAVQDLGMGTLDAAADIAGRFAEAYHGFTDDQAELQADHQEHAQLKAAMSGRRENILRDLGIHDGERDPDPEKTAGFGG